MAERVGKNAQYCAGQFQVNLGHSLGQLPSLDVLTVRATGRTPNGMLWKSKAALHGGVAGLEEIATARRHGACAESGQCSKRVTTRKED